MSFSDEVKKVVLFELSKLELICGSIVSVLIISNTETRILNSLIQEGIISKEEIGQAIHPMLIKKGRNSFNEQSKWTENLITPVHLRL